MPVSKIQSIIQWLDYIATIEANPTTNKEDDHDKLPPKETINNAKKFLNLLEDRFHSTYDKNLDVALTPNRNIEVEVEDDKILFSTGIGMKRINYFVMGIDSTPKWIQGKDYTTINMDIINEIFDEISKFIIVK